MKKTILLFLIPFCYFYKAHSQIIAAEDFDYTAGTGINVANGGTGWSGSWQVITVGADKLIVNDSLANYRIGKKSGSFLRLNYDALTDRIRFERRLASSITDDGNTYWLAFTMNTTDGSNNIMTVSLADVDATGDSGPGGQPIIVGKTFGDRNLGLGTNAAQLLADKEAQGTQFLVLKVEFSNDASADQLSLFIDPDPAQEPANEDADISWSTTALNSGFNGIFIKLEGVNPFNPLQVDIDDLVLAGSYGSVFPTGAVDIEKYIPVAEKFNYTENEGIVGEGTASGGWAGPWENLNSGFDAQVVADSVVNQFILKATGKNALELDQANGVTQIKRPLAARYEDNGLTYWLSFFADFSGATTNSVMNVMLVDNDLETYNGTSANGQLLQIGKMFNNEDLGVAKGGGALSTLPGLANTGHWFVARIETNGTTADADTVRLFLDPDPDTEPQVGTESLKYSGAELNDGWKAIGIKIAGGAATLASIVDDIYLGLSYDEVVPDDLKVVDNAPVLAFDKFAYNTTDTLRITEPMGVKENGWNGPWTSLKGKTYFAEDSIANFQTGVLRATRKNAMDLDLLNSNNTIRAYRGLETPYLDNGRTYWLGYWAKSERSGGANVSQIILCDTATVAASGGSGQLLGVGINFNNNNVQIDRGAGTRDTGIEGDTPRWIVAKIITNGSPADDEVKLFIDPSPGTEPDDSEAVASVTVNTLNSGWNGIFIKHDGPQGLRTVLDNLYIGNSYEDITPDDLEPLVSLIPPTAAIDKFEYSTGETLSSSTSLSDEGSGWDGPWVHLKGTITIVKDSIESQFNLKGTTPNAMEWDLISQPTGIRAYRRFETPYSDDGRTYWLGYWAKTERMGGANVSQIMLSKVDELAATGPNGQLMGIGIDFDNDNLKLVGGTPGNNLSDVPGDSTHWIVTKIVTTGDAEPDSLYLFANPEPGVEPLNSEAIASTSTTTLANGFDGLMIKHDGPVGIKTIIDDLYMGNSFDEITPNDLRDVEKIFLPTAGYEPFDYSTGSSLDGSGADLREPWASAWQKVNGSDAVINAESLDNGLTQTSGGSVTLSTGAGATNVSSYDRVIRPRLIDDGNEIWISFLMSANDNQENVSSQLAMLDGTEEVISFGRITGDSTLGVKVGSGFESAGVDVTGTNWIVAKINLSGDGGVDEVRTWVNPQPGFAPQDASAQVILTDASDVNFTLTGFDGLRILTEGVVSSETSFDEIRFGFEFADVSKLQVLPAVETKMFLVAGQSNARGRADVNSSIKPGSYALEYKYGSDELLPVMDPVGENELSFEQANIGSFVPSFAQSYHESSDLNVVVVHAAKGGSALVPAADIGNGDWSSTGVHFDNAVLKLNSAIKLSTVPLSGIIWAQGENEGLTDGAVTAEEYKSALKDLIQRFRDEYGPVPFYIVETGRYTLSTSIDEAFAEIRGAQREVAAEDPLTFIGYNKTEDFVDLGWMKADGVHYTIDGLDDIGLVLGQSVVENNPDPTGFDLLEPADAAAFELGVNDSIKFVWSKSNDTDQLKYLLELSSGGEMFNYELVEDTVRYVQVSDLGENSSFTWTVRVTDGIDTVQSSVRTFELVEPNVPPTAFNLIEPTNAASLQLQGNDSIKFVWSNSSDTDELNYLLELSSEGEMFNYEVIDDTVRYVKISDLGEKTSFSWTVRVTDGVDTVQSSIRTFELVEPNMPPAAFSLIEPADGASFQLQENDSIKFVWSNSNDTEQLKYLLELSSEGELFSYEIIEDTIGYVKISDLGEKSSFSWTVLVTDGADTVQSGSRSFDFQIITSLESLIETGVSIFPNPARYAFTIQFDIKSLRWVEIIDTRGSRVDRFFSDDQEILIDISSYQKGIYLINIDGEEGIRLVKE